MNQASLAGLIFYFCQDTYPNLLNLDIFDHLEQWLTGLLLIEPKQSQ